VGAWQFGTAGDPRLLPLLLNESEQDPLPGELDDLIMRCLSAESISIEHVPSFRCVT
jgi:hypothetical protein